MKLLPPLMLSLTLTLAACQTESAPATEETGGSIPQDVATLQNQVVYDGNWLSYWNDFKQMVDKESKVMAMGLIHFPLIGAEHLSQQGAKDGVTADEFRHLYFRVIDEPARQAIAPLKAMDIPYYSVLQEGYANSIEMRKGVPVGTKVYTVEVKLPPIEGSELTNRTRTYYFAKADGDSYKLAWVKMEN